MFWSRVQSLPPLVLRVVRGLRVHRCCVLCICALRARIRTNVCALASSSVVHSLQTPACTACCGPGYLQAPIARPTRAHTTTSAHCAVWPLPAARKHICGKPALIIESGLWRAACERQCAGTIVYVLRNGLKGERQSRRRRLLVRRLSSARKDGVGGDAVDASHANALFAGHRR